VAVLPNGRRLRGPDLPRWIGASPAVALSKISIRAHSWANWFYPLNL